MNLTHCLLVPSIFTFFIPPTCPVAQFSVTFPVSNVSVEPYQPQPWFSPLSVPSEVLAEISTTHTSAKLLQSSVDGTQEIFNAKNGFVHGVIEAYSKHRNLVIRPDDVWIAILSQINFYVTAHAEELRDKFVDHGGKIELVVTSSALTLDQADFGEMTVQMTGLINKNVKDKSLIPWVLPDFSTTTTDDTVISSALIMSTLKQYFDYEMIMGCGIPFLTLEGTKEDWLSILNRIDKISEFGDEPAEWATMLRVILKRFVRAFDVGGPEADAAFWERMVHETPGASSVPFISGWIAAFCAWDINGVFFAARNHQDSIFEVDTYTPSWVKGLEFDGVWFPRVNEAPEGYAEVDVKVTDEFGDSFNCTMLAGHVGYNLVGKKRQQRDTVRISPQWFMYVKGEERKVDRDFWSNMDDEWDDY